MSLSKTLPTILLAGVAALAVAAPAAAQNTTITPLPGAERFDLPPGNTQPGNTQQTPTPTPTPATPPPVVRTVPTPVPTATPHATSPSPTPTPRATATPTPTPTSSPTPTPSPTASPSEVPAIATAPVAAPSAQPLPAPTPAATAEDRAGLPAWLWGVGLAALATGLGALWLARRRRAIERAAPIAYAPAPAAAPPAPVPAAPPAPAAAPKPAPAPAPAPRRALGFDLRPRRLWTRGPNAYLDFELLVTNTAQAAISGVRPVIALISAGPDTAAEVAAFGGQLSSLPGGEPFDLRGGETRVVTGELILSGNAMHVTEVSGRDLIVPVAMVGATWRGDLSVASVAEAFVIGTGDASAAKLGPVWVDRPGQIYGRLDARRFTPR